MEDSDKQLEGGDMDISEKIGYQAKDGSMHFFNNPEELSAFKEEENNRDNQ